MYSDLTAEPLLAAFLPKLDDLDGGVRGFQVLNSGLSGAHVYLLYASRANLVLKLTPRDSSRLALERAQREFCFYQELAAQVPLSVAHLRQAVSDTDGTALLFTAYHASPEPPLWQLNDFLTTAHQLAVLHATFWHETPRLATLQWLKQQRVGTEATEIQQAQAYWRALANQPRYQKVLTKVVQQQIINILQSIADIDAAIHILPLTLCHGDCITTNILRDSDGNCIWIDWQEVGFARGPEDLAFLLQRAAVAGAPTSPDDIILAYQASLKSEGGIDIPMRTMRRVIEAAELRSRVLDWPAYLNGVAEAELAQMIQRIDVLADGLNTRF